MRTLFTKIKAFSPRIYWREILSLLMLLLAFIFFRSERRELASIIPSIENSDPRWLMAGIAVTILYVLFQSGIYVSCFAAIGLNLKWINAIELFLKRNLLSIFLPAGGISALAYTPSQLRKRGFNKTQIHQASGLYGFTGLLTVFLVGVPVLVFALTGKQNMKDAWLGLVLIVVLIAGIYWMARSLNTKGKLYRFIENKFPKFVPFVDELFAAKINTKKYAGAVLFSTTVEFSGIFHLMIAMLALGLPVSFAAAAVAYMSSILLMISSPFLRGLGAVEISLVYILGLYGYTPVAALSITILYRVFEFWLPLVLGVFAFLWRGRQLFIRIVPSLFIFMLGLINIISAIIPPINMRMKLIREFLPIDAINGSNLLVLFLGLALLITSAFMLKGLKNAWFIAIILAAFSLIGHLTKALDYEEACFAGVIIVVLLITRSQYRIRSSIKWMRLGLLSVIVVFAAVLIFGYVGFYYIDVRHFGVDFSWKESLIHTAKSFLLVEDSSLQPRTHFAQQFELMIRLLGFTTWGFLLFTLIKPFLKIEPSNESNREKAKFLLSQYGNSAVDYFKLYKDKLFFFSDLHDAFIAYRIANGFAVVLEEPVCAEENKLEVLQEFDLSCRKMGLKTAFYRVDENSFQWFNQLRKQKMLIGQEAILEVEKFTLQGPDKKSIRNGLNSLTKKGFVTSIHKAPLSDEMVIELKNISDEWLLAFDKGEIIFSQGMFESKEIKHQDIIALADSENNIVAFLNIIPDYAPDECTYDLIRKIATAPGGCMDALIIKLIEYSKEKNCQYINLGLVPLSGIIHPENPAEQLIKYASTRLTRFKHYHNLRNFKEKYATIWENKFLIYENDFDLLQLPAALNKVMQP
ncbi:MAG: phosphatidylglycerol lysyltransferase domain-containing protein [Ferruginibacter sp.]